VEFACGLLNAQPMGFYAPSTIVEDAKRHNVEVRSVDVLHSGWDCTMEPIAGAGERFALRMGLRYVKGLSTAEGERVVHASFGTLQEFLRATRLSQRALRLLAEAGALDGFGLDRRATLWAIEGAAKGLTDTLPLDEDEAVVPRFRNLDLFETIAWDYRASHHSTRGHPLLPLRERMREQGLPDARAIGAMGNGRRVRYAGIVICRQRPGTAAGVTFLTMEDETGFVNVVIWRQVFERWATLVKTTPFLGVSGKIQHEKGVVHLMAEAFWVPALDAQPKLPKSRDFR
jgi:error-prone DNA polymerase